MRVDGREITVSGSLLQPLSRRTNDILRLVLATVFLAVVITSSLITRYDWVALEQSISEIVGVLTPTQSNLVYLVYGVAILALPFVILIGLIVGTALEAARRLRGGRDRRRPRAVDQPDGIAAPQWHFDLSDAARHLPVAVPRRPALDRDARGGAHGVGPVAARAVAAVVVDAAAGLRADPPRRQRRGACALAARPGGRAGSSARWWYSSSAPQPSRCRSTAPCGRWPGVDSR